MLVSNQVLAAFVAITRIIVCLPAPVATDTGLTSYMSDLRKAG